MTNILMLWISGDEIKLTNTTLPPVKANVTNTNITSTEEVYNAEISKPGAIERGIIVFGGFALLAVAYFIFYR